MAILEPAPVVLDADGRCCFERGTTPRAIGGRTVTTELPRLNRSTSIPLPTKLRHQHPRRSGMSRYSGCCNAFRAA
jgi:hypothetical protein